MKQNLKIWGVLISLGFFTAMPVLAENATSGPKEKTDQTEFFQCPKVISVPQGSDVAENIKTVIQAIYLSLGCEADFRYTSPSRQLMEFNRGAVDGELFRVKGIEKKYKKAFVGSVALMTLDLGIMGRPDAEVGGTIGYQKGVSWQEKYVLDLKNQNKKIHGFHSHDQLFEAYERGTISYFFGSWLSYQSYFGEDKNRPPVVMKRQLISLDLHHYVDAKFKDFMASFNRYIEWNKPFSSPRDLN